MLATATASPIPTVTPAPAGRRSVSKARPTITYTSVHPTFGAEASGVDFNNVTQEVVDAIKEGLAKYGVLVFRKTGLDDARHVEMAKLFGDLDDVAPFVKGLGVKNRLSSDYLFDVSNLDPDGNISALESKRALLLRCNYLFHSDSAFNPRRAGVSILLAHQLPPLEAGGHTEFADTRTAYEDLDDETKDRIQDWVVCNSQLMCRRRANEGNPMFDTPEFDPEQHPFGRHKLVQVHEASGRKNLYIAAHAHHVDGLPVPEGQRALLDLLEHAGQPKYVTRVTWKDPGDLVMWDNTCTLHRAVPGNYAGKYKRDLRRATVHDMSSQAWGLNEQGSTYRYGLDD